MDLRPDPVLERLRRSLGMALSGLGAGAGPGEVSAALREVEAVALEAPIEAGGFELGVGCGAVTARELGRRALPDVYGPAVLVLDALRAAGLADRATAAALVEGDSAVVVGGLDRPAVSVREAYGRRILSGSVVVEERGDQPDAWCCVAAAADGEILLVLVPASVWRRRARPAAVPAAPAPVTGSGANPTLSLVDLEGADLEGVDLEGVAVEGGEVIASFGAGEPWPDPDGLLARARIRLAAYLLGLADGAQAAAVHYAARRMQFGRPLLDNQALAFPLAQAQVELTALELRVRHAARLADGDSADDWRLAAAETLAMAQEAAAATVHLAMQVHGARSLTTAEPIHAFHLAVRSFGTVLGPRSPLWREAGLRRLTARAAAGTLF